MDMAITGKAICFLPIAIVLRKILMSSGYSNLDLVELETYVDSVQNKTE